MAGTITYATSRRTWQRLLDEGKYRSITEIAAAEGMDLGRASRIVRLVRLAPDIVNTLLSDGENGLALESLSRRSIPVDWEAQRLRLLKTEL